MDLIEDLTSFLSTAPNPLVAVLGATATGKTKLSLEIAKAIDGEIISTDSRQIYREMPIATDIILPEEQQGIVHHMLEIADPDKTLTLAEFKDIATEKIKDIHSRNKIPMLVGGTGLYVSAITQGYDVPRIPPNPELREELEKLNTEDLHKKLEDLDPESAAKIHANNRRYVIRTIEINSHSNKKDYKTKSPYDLFFIALERPREEIYERIEQRVDQQIERGLVQEVQALLNKNYDENLPSMSSLGVKEIIPYLRGEMALDEALIILKRNTRRYAKRQMTWLRRYDNVTRLNQEQVTECLKKLSQISKN
ncbi:tRNA (adenosine(37)-N6)-dimethylallyltransferase MiaA [Candidatus Gracilibacteria bacterium]|nr:tRNA (adenosine(37)-N6)-dimethylallyltransferase MiaA [Candidatus Gracilibacteria bacterium]